jgi:D-alanyl-D-alanine carboxypeptidase
MRKELLASLFLAAALPLRAQAPASLPSETRAEIDRAVRDALEKTGAPSASVAVVRDGRLAYRQAFGKARLDPPADARPEMRYGIGSISKQFTATSVLLLAEEGKLSLDDPVERFVPGLTRGREVTVRQLLSHMSGYQDYWPQDYVPPFMRRETTAAEILDRWAKKPLDFEPGTQYQYSNTGYVAAGLVVEKASGTPLLELLKARVFAPLGMESVADIDRAPLGGSDPVGYLRYGLGPPRPAPKEGRGWLFAAGELAMSAEDLAKWNVAWIERRVLRPASYAEIERETLLKNGVGTRYGLGVGVRMQDGHRALTHGGEVSGFTATNTIFPDDRAAVTVLTNQDSSGASGKIAEDVARILFAGKESPRPAEERARRILEELARGRIDRSLFTDNGNSYFTGQALADFAASLAPLGKPVELRQTESRPRGGMTFRLFRVKFSVRSLEIWERDMPDGKIEQYQVMPAD